MARERNVAFGIVLGFLFACVYAVIALLIFLFRGNEPFQANEISLGA